MKKTITYKSKRLDNVYAVLISEDVAKNTVTLAYVNGNDAGTNITISLNTLKRWWHKMNPEEEPDTTKKEVDTETVISNVLDIDMEKVNEPYPEPKFKKKIKKPDSVVKYEQRRCRSNPDLPSFEELIEMFKPVLNRVNEPSLYITLTNKCMVCKKAKSIDVVATEEVMPSLAETGLLCKPYAYKAAPYMFKLVTLEMLEKAKEVLFNV